MRQCKLIEKIYKACFIHDVEKLAELRKTEFRKIFKRRAEGKSVCTPKWTVVRV